MKPETTALLDSLATKLMAAKETIEELKKMAKGKSLEVEAELSEMLVKLDDMVDDRRSSNSSGSLCFLYEGFKFLEGDFCPECKSELNPDGRCLDRHCGRFNTFINKA